MAITQPAVTEQRNGPSTKQNHVTNVTRVHADADGIIRLTESHGALKSVDVADVDLVLGFADGSYIIIPNGALDALEVDAPKVEFDGDKFNTSLTELFQQVGTVDAADAGNLRIISENIDTRLTELQPDEIDYTSLFMALNNHASAPTAPAAPLPQAPTLPQAAQVQRGSINGRGNNSGEFMDAIIPPRVDQPSTYRLGNRVESAETLRDIQNLGLPVIDGQLYVSPELKTGTDFRNDLPLGARGAIDPSNPSHNPATPAAQAHREVITGTAGNDNINLNSNFAATGEWSKNLYISTNGFNSIDSFVIMANGNLPAGFDLKLNPASTGTIGKDSNGNWVISADALQLQADGSYGVDLELVYDLTADGVAVTPVDFVLQAIIHGQVGPFAFQVSKDLNFSYRDATEANDFNVIVDGKPWLILPARGIGYDIHAGEGDNIVHGGAGNDLITSGNGNNELYGGAGNDTLQGGSGANKFFGDTGKDTVTYENAGSSVVVNLLDNQVNNITNILNVAQSGNAAGDQFDSIENLVGSQYADHLIGDRNANHIFGGDGNDTIEGIGNTIGNGGDTLDGGTGSNTVSYAHAEDNVTVNLAQGHGQIAGYERDSLSNFDTVIGAINHSNTLTGNGNANLLVGGNLNDTLQGGAGADTLDGGGGINTALYTTQVNVSLTPGLITATGDAAGDVFIDIRNLEATTGNNRLIGDAQDNYIKGGSGNDTLAGMGGNDTLDGGGTWNGSTWNNGGNNTVTYQYMTKNTGDSSTNGVDITLASGNTRGTATITGSGNSVGTDELINIQNAIGSNFNDTIRGSASNNNINAGAGDDLIFINNGGKDTVYGGAGDDTVVASVDAITGNVANNWSNRFALVDGQGGTDTLALEGFVNGAAYELATLVGLVRSIETIDISQQAYGLQASSTNMTVSTQSIQGLMASGSSSVINIVGDNTDKLSFSLGAGETVWFNGSQLSSAIDLINAGTYSIHDANNNVVAQVNWTVA
ncbi:calcium-binding protein [Methylobacillus flagellatus]|uniref:calcium-binding protein n=1 Tax=Methylobacillus flagellatus TaxID=405 RepID=UPI0028541A9C|nr:calcium-binding protein [Methylobacillus flagellatus]MDR5171812.1 calcium-binding protein [Methylobacillus flagellatus]